MKIKLILSLCYIIASLHFIIASDKIYPTPQVVKQTGKNIQIPQAVQLHGAEGADASALQQLRQLFQIEKQKKNYPIYIGKRGDKSIKKYSELIPQANGGYYLSITPEQMIIAGNDARGTFYAVQTLKQLLHDNLLPEIAIKDFPAVAYRGVVEGFYGQPWSHEDRIRQLQFYGEYKLNTYIYGPKDDPYHSSPHWRKPYPEKEAGQISELVALSKANHVDFVWAIHPGKDIRWNEEDLQALLDKFENMYQLGVRSFAVFFDDISGDGTDPVRQAELLNTIQDRFISQKKDVTPLIMCPTEYNKSWSNPKEGTYLDILGEKLYPSVMVMWTGDRVISDITTEGLEWVNRRIKRPAYVWWNFPVSDYVRDHLLMGPSYGLDLTAGKLMSGFVSNPMERAEASKIAIFSIADYAWNPTQYNSNEVWEAAIQTIMPNAAKALHTFAAHNSDLGPNGHRYRRDESVEIKPVVEKFIAAYKQRDIPQTTLEQLFREYQKIAEAPDQLKAANDNPALINEISPWLEQFEILGKMGQEALNLARLSTQGITVQYWQKYLELQTLDQQRRQIDRTYNQNPYQPGVKTGSLIMQPFIDSIRLISEQHVTGHTAGSHQQAVPELYTNIKQIQNLPIQTGKNSIAISPVLEVIRIAPKQYIGITLPFTLTQATIAINLGITNALQWGKMQASADGKTWEYLEAKENETNITVRLPENLSVQFIRFINLQEQPQEIYLKKFSIQPESSFNAPYSVGLLTDNSFRTAYHADRSQTISIDLPISRKQTEFILLSDLKEGMASIRIIGETKRNQEIDLGTIRTAYGTFSCPENVNTIRLEINTSEPINLYELMQ
ncbi:beta-N-acetylglucosaminidase [Odoribacter lunatus]|uniref:beta-N-acetylglucosaminidase n=1 Tax=Odoribacter lunatus TaxID=2941335 RepID=UPI00203D992F|nr:beta-N-acetylglucosaminidase [Odoribacter lunatus]